MMTQLNPPLPLHTPKGRALAVALIDYGPQWDLQWVTFLNDNGECCTFRNSQIRQERNHTFDFSKPSEISNPTDIGEKKPEAPIRPPETVTPQIKEPNDRGEPTRKQAASIRQQALLKAILNQPLRPISEHEKMLPEFDRFDAAEANAALQRGANRH